MRKKSFIFITALLMLCTAVADATVYIRPKYVGCELNQGAVSPKGEETDKLVDDDNEGNTKWCVLGFTSASIEVNTGAPVKVKYLQLRTGNDTKDNHWRNWRTFAVYGKGNNGAWELIKRFPEVSPPAEDKSFFVVDVSAQKFYQNYKVEILATWDKKEMQMSDMQFGLDDTGIVHPKYVSHNIK